MYVVRDTRPLVHRTCHMCVRSLCEMLHYVLKMLSNVCRRHEKFLDARDTNGCDSIRSDGFVCTTS